MPGGFVHRTGLVSKLSTSPLGGACSIGFRSTLLRKVRFAAPFSLVVLLQILRTICKEKVFTIFLCIALVYS